MAFPHVLMASVRHPMARIFIGSPANACNKNNILSNNRNLTVVNLSVFLKHQQF